MDTPLVEAVLNDWRTAPVSAQMRTTLGFLAKLTRTPDQVTPDDVAPLRQIGLSDEAIADAINVCFVFSMINRLADAFEFEIPDQGQLRNRQISCIHWAIAQVSYRYKRVRVL